MADDNINPFDIFESSIPVVLLKIPNIVKKLLS